MCRYGATVALALAACLAVGACRQESPPQGGSPMALRDIQAVQEENIPALMARPGVVGVAIGALADGTPCIAVYVATAADSARLALPTAIEGHPVRVEVTGEIRPLGQ
jgi:hypothetical protein